MRKQRDDDAFLQLLNAAGFQKITPQDRIVISYRKPFMQFRVTRPSGVTEEAIKIVCGSRFTLKDFDPKKLPKDERNKMIRDMKSDWSQMELAKIFRCSQSTIHVILHKST